MSNAWKSIWTPPTILSAVIYPYLILLNSSYICSANYLDGTRTIAWGPLSELVPLIRGRFSTWCRTGIKNPRVFPSPVGAIATISLFSNPIGIDCIWIGLGFENLSLLKFFTNSGDSSENSSHSRNGLATLPPLINIYISSRKILQSRSVISSIFLSFQGFSNPSYLCRCFT